MNTLIDKTNTKILIIDDEPGIRNLLSYELGLQGYSVTTAPNGEEGIELVKKDKFNLLLSDVKMPRMDGIQVLEAAKKIDPDIEVIMITGFGTIGTAVDAIKKGAYDFVQKPFNLDEILTLVEKALEKADLKALVTLYETSKAIFSAIKLDDLLPILIALSLKLLKADDVSIMLKDENGELRIAASHGLETEDDRSLRLRLGDKFMKNTKERPEISFIVGPLENEQELSGMGNVSRVRSAVICPLLSKTKSLGVLIAAKTKSEIQFNYSDQRYADIFASQVSQAVDNAQLYNELEKKVSALNEAYGKLTEAHKELIQSEKLAAIGQLSAGVAHELNNPLTIVIGLTELMLEDKTQTQEKINDLQSIKTQAERCRSIILNLLQFAQKNETEKKSVQINSIIEKTIELWRYNVSNAKIAIIRDFDPSLSHTVVNPFLMQQVFINILNNAHFAMGSTEKPQITIKTANEGKNIRITFKDNGCGIEENIIGKIFDPFFTTKDVGKGTGLGLSITYGIVREHGGDIRVESKEGEGSMFIIDLPVVAQ